MITKIVEQLEALTNENSKKKLIKEKCDLSIYGVKISDLKKIIKEYKIKNNNELAKELIATNIYDAVYLGYLIMDLKTIEKEYLVSLITQSTYFRIRINNLAYSMAEHPEYQYFIDYLANKNDDTHQSIYYAVLAGRIIIDPEYENEKVFTICQNVEKVINSELYKKMPETRHEMNHLIGYAGMQIPKYDKELIAIYQSYIGEYNHEIVNRRNSDQAAFIQMCIDREIQAKSRKSCRC